MVIDISRWKESIVAVEIAKEIKRQLDTGTNFSLYKNLRKLDAYGYRKVLYCNENIIVANGGKTIREYSDAYHISIQKF